MNRILIVGPDMKKAKGGMAQVIAGVLEDEELSTKYDMHVFSSYKDGSLPFIIAYGVLRFIVFFFTVPFYDMVHIHMTVKGSAKRKGIYVRIAKFFHKKVVLQIHRCEKFTDWLESTDEKTRRSVIKTLAMSDAVLCLSDTWMKHLEEVAGITNCRYLPNGIDPEKFAYSLDGEGVIYMGRIMKEKGLEELLLAKQMLEERGVMFPLHIAGPIDDAKPYIRLSDKLGLTSVFFEGWVSGEKKKELLRDAAVMVLPSYGEGFPVSILEGIASGCAIVATDIASVHDMIEEEIVPIKDAAALADALERMMTNPDRRRKSAEKNMKRLRERFTAKAVHEKLGECYEEVLCGRQN